MISFSRGCRAGDLADLRQKAAREQRDGNAGALGGGPEPVHRAVRGPGLLMRLEEGEAQAEHAGPGLPRLDQRTALRAIEREVAEDRQPIGVLARRLDGELIGIRIPRRRRMDEGGVDARLVHLLEQVVLREGGHLPVSRVRGLAAAPDVHLRVDDQHGSDLLVLRSDALGGCASQA